MDNRTEFDKSITPTPESYPDHDELGLSPEEGAPPAIDVTKSASGQEPWDTIKKPTQAASGFVPSRPGMLLTAAGLIAGMASLFLMRRRG